LIASGYATQGWTIIPSAGERLLLALADTLPSYHLPTASAAHSRHYMPMTVLDKGREKTTLVFDTWAQIDDGVMAITWPVELDAECVAMLGTLVTAIGYLGRSESWVDATLTDSDTPPSGTRPAYPCADNQHPGPGWEQVLLTAAESPTSFAAWRGPLVEFALAEFPLSVGKKPGKKLLEERSKATSPFPTDLLDALQWDTARWKSHRWGQPPGSRKALYWRRVDALEVGPPTMTLAPVTGSVTAVLLALATPGRNASALPMVARTLPQAELFHHALVRQAANGQRINCPELTGRDEHGRRLTGHQHAYVLPVDLDLDGHLDHILIYARCGLGMIAQRAITSLRRTWQKGGNDLQVSVAGGGALTALRDLPESLQPGVVNLLGSVGGSRVWINQTPFVPPRFMKPTGRNSLTGQIEAELTTHGHPPASIEILPWSGQNLPLRHAIRVRRGQSSPPPADCGFAIRITFPEPVSGPIALGYGSHFGLGLFAAES